MFTPGKTYKVKLEGSPGDLDFGRATVVDRIGSQLCIYIKTSKDPHGRLAKGTKIWFVNDSPNITFNGLWASTVQGQQIVQGKTLLLCAQPRLEPLVQRRRSPRVTLDVPVDVIIDGEEVKSDTRTRDISRSGIAIESPHNQGLPDTIEAGNMVKLVVHAPEGDVAVEARVIRVEKSWFANKITVGLEYTDVDAESIATLDKVLIRLGGKPRVEGPGIPEQKPATAKSGLGAWLPNTQESRGRFVRSRSGTTSEEDIPADLEAVQNAADDLVVHSAMEEADEEPPSDT